MSKMLDELKTIKLGYGQIAVPSSPMKPPSKDVSKASIAIGTSEIDQNKSSNSVDGKTRIMKPPSINPMSNNRRTIDNTDISPIPKKPRREPE